MTKEPTQEEIDASPTLSAIQAIKYAENDPEGRKFLELFTQDLNILQFMYLINYLWEE